MADMTREEAARVLESHAKNGAGVLVTYGLSDALRMGAAALRGWVKTADRLPEEDEPVIALVRWFGTKLKPIAVEGRKVIEFPDDCAYWMPLPKLPEVEG